MSKNVKNVTMEKRVMTEAQFNELKVPKNHKLNIYNFANALKANYFDGKSLDLTADKATCLGIAPVDFKAWTLESEKLYKLIVVYVNQKHDASVSVDVASKSRTAIATAVKRLFNLFFVKDTEGFYEFNKNDIENIIFCAETMGKNGTSFENLQMDTRKKVTLRTVRMFRKHLLELLMFKLYGDGVISQARQEALDEYNEVLAKAKKINATIKANGEKIKAYSEMMEEDESVIEFFRNKIKALELENKRIKAEFEEVFENEVKPAYNALQGIK